MGKNAQHGHVFLNGTIWSAQFPSKWMRRACFDIRRNELKASFASSWSTIHCPSIGNHRRRRFEFMSNWKIRISRVRPLSTLPVPVACLRLFEFANNVRSGPPIRKSACLKPRTLLNETEPSYLNIYHVTLFQLFSEFRVRRARRSVVIVFLRNGLVTVNVIKMMRRMDASAYRHTDILHSYAVYWTRDFLYIINGRHNRRGLTDRENLDQSSAGDENITPYALYSPVSRLFARFSTLRVRCLFVRRHIDSV